MLQWIQVNTFSQPSHHAHAYYYSYGCNQKVQPSISNGGFSILFMLNLPDGNEQSLMGASTAGQWGEEDARWAGAGTSLLYSHDITAGALMALLINEWWLQVRLRSSLPTNVIESCWAWSAGAEWLLSEGEGGNDCEPIAGAVICWVCVCFVFFKLSVLSLRNKLWAVFSGHLISGWWQLQMQHQLCGGSGCVKELNNSFNHFCMYLQSSVYRQLEHHDLFIKSKKNTVAFPPCLNSKSPSFCSRCVLYERWTRFSVFVLASLGG